MCSSDLRRLAQGLNLLELLLAVGLLTLITALGTVSLYRFRAQATIGAAANALQLALLRARATALSTGLSVSLCAADSRGRCAAGMAGNGYRSTRVDGVILEQATLPQGLRLRSNRPQITYGPTPRAGTTATLTVCDPTVPEATRQVIISQTGRPRVAATPAAPCG